MEVIIILLNFVMVKGINNYFIFYNNNLLFSEKVMIGDVIIVKLILVN